MPEKHDDKLYLESILGLMVIDTKGTLVYLNQQCADYIKVDREKAIGKHINKVFPPSKMADLLSGNKIINTDFYFHEGRMSVSTQVQLRSEGKVVGVLEYDTIQELHSLEVFLNKYTSILDEEMKYYREQLRNLRRTKYSIDNLIGSSEEMRSLKNQIKMAAMSNSTILITGETGTGKELVAHAVHNLSKRAFGEFVKINASSVPESLAESELFGYEEGAFTGARKGGKKGKFELANNGTLFIDEINQMPLSIQPKLLRALQEHEVERIGSESSMMVDVRVIAASNVHLEDYVDSGKFRSDLYYRLNVFPLVVPPLRERLSDIPDLVMNKVNELNLEMGKNVETVESSVFRLLSQHDWPGNVRELHNAVEKAMIYCDSETLHTGCFPQNTFEASGHKTSKDIRQNAGGRNVIKDARDRAERLLIIEALKVFDGNKTRAAEFLNIQRPLLYQKMERLGIKNIKR